MTKHDYDAMRKAEKRTDRALTALCAVLMAALVVSLYLGLQMRGVI